MESTTYVQEVSNLGGPAFAGKSNKVIMSAVATAGAGKAMRKEPLVADDSPQCV